MKTIKVYVVNWLQSYDGPIFRQVFGSREQAESYVNSHSKPVADLYEIDECEIEIEDCLACAYNQIKDRKGVMKNGIFIKDTEL